MQNIGINILERGVNTLNRRIPVIISAVRTPIGRFGGTLANIPAVELGAVAIKAAVDRAGIDPCSIDEVLMGQVVQAGAGQAPARQAAIKAGLPADFIRATTVNKICGSGLKTIMMAASMIKAGDGDIYVAGGMESMDQCPYMLKQGRTGYRLGNGELLDAVVNDGLWCAFENHHMGASAEWIAKEFNLTREELDRYAYESQMKAAAAQASGKFEREIVPVLIPQRKGDPLVFDQDEALRPDTTLDKLARLTPAFVQGGMVTAGNSPGITDGAAAVVVMALEKAEELGLQPLAAITGYDQAGVKPLEIFTAPIYAVRNLMAKTGAAINDYDLIEANEAFAAQCLADGRALEWDWDRVNVNGGAIALGHPIGCSGARVMVTLLYALQDRGLKTGMATLCLGGGEAVAMSVEML
ncbi:MAG: acetyl-CoA C-acetyltransferase [Anaerolineales bacterium]|nr:acetyl-CoA C-acetyltransferase [Anaerolineales bacterium]